MALLRVRAADTQAPSVASRMMEPYLEKKVKPGLGECHAEGRHQAETSAALQSSMDNQAVRN